MERDWRVLAATFLAFEPNISTAGDTSKVTLVMTTSCVPSKNIKGVFVTVAPAASLQDMLNSLRYHLCDRLEGAKSAAKSTMARLKSLQPEEDFRSRQATGMA